jgi:type I restriction enzyme, S subunit
MLTHRGRSVLGNIPADWNVAPVRALIRDQFAGDWGEDAGEEAVAVIRSTNFTDDGRLDLTDVATRYFPKQKAEEFLLQAGDLLVERSGGGPEQPVGRIAFIDRDLARTTVSNFVQVLRPDPARANAEFLGWVLFELQRSGIVERVQQQSTQMRNLNWRDYQRLPLPSPDLPEQTRIAAALRQADDAILTARAQLDATRCSKRAVMSALLIRGSGPSNRATRSTPLGVIPSDWTVSELRSLWTSSTNGVYVPEQHYGSGIPIVRIDTFDDGAFSTRDFKRIRVRQADVESYQLRVGDLLLNRVNSIPFLGKVVYVDTLEEFTVFESNMMRLRFPSSELSEYLAIYLSAPATRKRIWTMGRPAVAQLSVNQRDVGRFLVALPEEGERVEIVKAVYSARLAEEKVTAALQASIQVKSSLLRALLTGTVRIPERTAHV